VSTYAEIEDYTEFQLPTPQQIVFFACCDCGLVHGFVLAEEKETGKRGIFIFKDNRRTAQLRRYKVGDLHGGEGKWRMIRSTEIEGSE